MDIRKIPFSCRGSYMAISYYDSPSRDSGGLYLRKNDKLGGLYLRTVSQNAPTSPVFRIQPLWDQCPVDFQSVFDGKTLKLSCADGEIVFCFTDPQTILCVGRGEKLGLRLDEISRPDSCNYVHRIVPDSPDLLCINCYKNFTRHLLFCSSGTMTFSQVWDKETAFESCIDITASNGLFTVFLREAYDLLDLEWPDISLEQACQDAEESLNAFLPHPEHFSFQYREAARTASYIQWASLAAPRGNLRSEAMLMSKNWMNSIWAWDHCFNAISLCSVEPDLAWKQWLLPFEYQRRDGVIPDFINDSTCFFNCVKIPVHGWALRQMMKRMKFSTSQLQQAYQVLSAWTKWWFSRRDPDRDGLCEYWHGNDSGWDNSTVFSEGPCVVSPELNSFLIVQMDVLHDLGLQLGRENEAQNWAERAHALADAVAEHLFYDGIPTPLNSLTHTPVANKSLLPYLSLVAYDYLPASCTRRMQQVLQSDVFLTPFGYATEQCSSPLFQEDGYWRGAIWAPVMYLLTDALEQSGDPETARKMAELFCRMATADGFAENYSALSGKGLRDPSYTWSASVFLLYVQQYFSEDLKQKG